MSTDTNKSLDRLISILAPLGAVLISLWWVGVYKGQTDSKLATHDKAIDSLTAIVAVDHDAVIGIRAEVHDLHQWLEAKTPASQAAGK
jgi:hypothetical protein